MQVLEIANNARTSPVLLYTGVPLMITAVLWATSLYDATLPQVIAAFILCWIPWAAYQKWVRGTREKDSVVRSNWCHVLAGLRGAIVLA
jgi:hypothetical protein